MPSWTSDNSYCNATVFVAGVLICSLHSSGRHKGALNVWTVLWALCTLVGADMQPSLLWGLSAEAVAARWHEQQTELSNVQHGPEGGAGALLGYG